MFDSMKGPVTDESRSRCCQSLLSSGCSEKWKTDPIDGSVSLSLARDYTLTGYATRFHLRVKASQNSISIFDTERKNKLTPEIGQEENLQGLFSLS
jgi:hypothetical protein